MWVIAGILVLALAVGALVVVDRYRVEKARRRGSGFRRPPE